MFNAQYPMFSEVKLFTTRCAGGTSEGLREKNRLFVEVLCLTLTSFSVAGGKTLLDVEYSVDDYFFRWSLFLSETWTTTGLWALASVSLIWA